MVAVLVLVMDTQAQLTQHLILAVAVAAVVQPMEELEVMVVMGVLE